MVSTAFCLKLKENYQKRYCYREKKTYYSPLLATQDLAHMTESGAAVAATAQGAVPGGRKATRRGTGLTFVLSGRQLSAPLVSPSTWIKAVR